MGVQPGQDRGRRNRLDLDAGARRAAAREDDVLHLLDVDLRLAQHVQHLGQYADLISVPHDQDAGGLAAIGQVHTVFDLSGLQVTAEDAHDLVAHGFLGLHCACTDVMCAVDTGMLTDRVGEGLVATGRLLGEDIQPGAQVARLDGTEQRVLVDEAPAAGVDHQGTGAQRFQQAFIHQVLRLGHQGQVNGQRVGTTAGIQRGRSVLDSQVHGGLGGQLDAPGPDPHLHGERPLDHGPSDLATAEYGQRTTRQAPGLAVLLLAPAPGPQVSDIVRDAAVQVDQVADGQLGHRDGVLARAIGHVDAAGAGRVQIDGVDPGASSNHQGEAAPGLKVGGGHLGTADHQCIRVLAGEGPLQRLVLERGVRRDGAALVFQGVGHVFGELVSDEDTHVGLPVEWGGEDIVAAPRVPAGGVLLGQDAIGATDAAGHRRKRCLPARRA